MDKIDFSQVARRRQYSASALTKEPCWRDAEGVVTPISQLQSDHLQNIERFLRGGGATTANRVANPRGLKLIQAEMSRRGLPSLPDHDAAYVRQAASLQKVTVPGRGMEVVHTDLITYDEFEALRSERAKRVEVVETRLKRATQFKLPSGK